MQAWSSGLFLYLASSQAVAKHLPKPEAYIDPSQLGLVKASNTLVGAPMPEHGPSALLLCFLWRSLAGLQTQLLMQECPFRDAGMGFYPTVIHFQPNVTAQKITY